MRKLWPLLKETFSRWNAQEAPRLGAALTFYTVLSLAPLLVLVIAIAALAFGAGVVQEHVLHQVRSMIGEQGGTAVQAMLQNAQKPAAGGVAGALGLLTLLFGASGVFGELRSALNKIFDVDPRKSSGLMGMLRDRFFSFGMVLAIGFMLLVSLVISAVLAAMGKWFGGMLPFSASVMEVLNAVVSYVVITLLFAAIFKYVPETRLSWRSVLPGAFATAVLFTGGKILIGLYLGKASVGSAYGAAGSLVVVIVWLYYSAQIFYFGAEFTRVYAAHHGWQPESHASAASENAAAIAPAEHPAAATPREPAFVSAPAPARGERRLALAAAALWAAVMMAFRRGRRPV